VSGGRWSPLAPRCDQDRRPAVEPNPEARQQPARLPAASRLKRETAQEPKPLRRSDDV
jgi:hypothetical protein